MEPRSPAHLALGLAIREFRNKRGISQERLALISGVDRGYMGGVERGERNPSFTNILRITTALEISTIELFRRFEALRAAGD
jgi:transcriptional regulator with XRE-family HTH domain